MRSSSCLRRARFWARVARRLAACSRRQLALYRRDRRQLTSGAFHSRTPRSSHMATGLMSNLRRMLIRLYVCQYLCSISWGIVSQRHVLEPSYQTALSFERSILNRKVEPISQERPVTTRVSIGNIHELVHPKDGHVHGYPLSPDLRGSPSFRVVCDGRRTALSAQITIRGKL